MRSESGATAVEFALVAAPFIALLVAILQTMVVFFAQRLLDEVVSQASRTIQTGQAQTSGLTQSQFTSWVCQKTVILFTCANYMVNVQSYSSFSAATSANSTAVAPLSERIRLRRRKNCVRRNRRVRPICSTILASAADVG